MALQSTDPIADMLTRIRNSIAARKHEVRMPLSKIKETIARELQKAGYIHEVKVEKGTPRGTLVITIYDKGANAVITEIERISRPGRRVYASVDEIPRVKNGRGIVLISTSRGVMTDRAARKARLGGELICKVY